LHIFVNHWPSRYGGELVSEPRRIYVAKQLANQIDALKKKKKELHIKELPFLFKKRMFGTTKRNLFLFILTYFITIIKLRFGK